jgi:glycosyltransferase involved in cell wall biosynthesis
MISNLPVGLKVAIVHEWFVDYSGSERVVEQILNIFPEADLFAVVDFLPSSLRSFIRDKSVKTTFVQNLPGARTKYRSYLPLMPLAIEQHDLSAYDLIISSSHAVAKGVLTGPHQLHVSYIHSPMRYAWDLQHQYLRESGLHRGLKGWVARWLLHRIRLWDLRTANGVDALVANSKFVARRIWKVYRRTAQVIYPPVDVARFGLTVGKDDFYVTASRMVPYKRVALIVEAFSAMPNRKLVVIGDGPEFKRAKSKAASNVQLLGYQPLEVLRDHMQRARAFVFAAEEDFGITAVEAQACGTPVIAFVRGGVSESVLGIECTEPTGLFFHTQTVEAIIGAVEEFDRNSARFSPAACRANAERFSIERFRSEFAGFIEQTWKEFEEAAKGPDDPCRAPKPSARSRTAP